MHSQYSILKFMPNPLSGEAIAVGLLLLQEKSSFFKFSKHKLDLCSKLDARGASLFQLAVESLNDLFGHGDSEDGDSLFAYSRRFDESMLSRFAHYHNGVLRFSEPLFLKKEFDRQSFEQFYAKVIGAPVEVQSLRPKASRAGLVARVHRHLKRDLEGRIDINLTIQKQQLPDLFFDFGFDAVGYNGRIYAVKAVDFNRHAAAVNTIEKVLIEYDYVAQRISAFARKQDILKDGKYWLITDPYNGDNQTLKNLYKRISNGLPHVHVAPSAELPDFIEQVISNDAVPFSNLLQV